MSNRITRLKRAAVLGTAGLLAAGTVALGGGATAQAYPYDGFPGGRYCVSQNVIKAETNASQVLICRVPGSSQYVYKGKGKRNGLWVTIWNVNRYGNTFWAYNNGYSYRISPANLTIRNPQGSVISREYWWYYRQSGW